MSKKRLFLLGGHDLEMAEIKKLLIACGARPYGKGGDILFADKGLSWGAKLSDYAEMLDFDGEIYGIELVKDITKPLNYRVVDHHGKHWCYPSALEQVAELIGVTLDRWQQLVAANDKGHIAALEAMGATSEEIEKIRSTDMQAQGVTEEERAQACREAQNARLQKGIWIAETRLEHASPLVDFLVYQNKLPAIVVNRDKQTLTFYGHTVLKLLDRFKAAVDDKKAYYGGNPPGYFGFTESYFDEHSIEETIDVVIDLHREEAMHSYHIFMLPFLIDDAVPGAKGYWREIVYRIAEGEAVYRYNEYTYFHDFVRRVLFNDKSGEGISRYFEYSKHKGEYIIEVKGESYRLDLDGITLRHFENGVGILSFHLVNRRYDRLDDILRINDFGRHLFPQFLGDGLVESTIDTLLACSLTLTLEGERPMEERFDHYRDLSEIEAKPHRFPMFIERLLDEMYGKSDFTPIIDDRMYLICHFMNDELADRLTTYDKDGYAYETDGDWYRFVFVDNDSLNCQNGPMKKRLIAESTYPRWSDYGTLYGVTRYSFMLLTKKDWVAQNVLNRHMRTVYFQMVSLQLAYRAIALVFTNKVTNLLKDGKEKIDIQKSTTLYYEYLDFINRVYFREVTPQEQGIEIYEIMKSKMRTERDFKELDAEISELHHYIDMLSEKARNDRLETISILGAVLLPPTLLAGMFGMNMIDFGTSPVAAAVGVIMIFVSGYIGYHFFTDLKKKKLWGMFLFIILAAPIFWYIVDSAMHSQTTVRNQSTPKDVYVEKK